MKTYGWRGIPLSGVAIAKLPEPLDEFRVHANNCNHLRQQYINIFAELAESNIFSDILSQIYGQDVVFTKLSNNLGELIRGSNYSLS